MSGHVGDLSQQQQQALLSFRAKLDSDSKTDDYTCLRFLRARNFDVDESYSMYANFAAWRKREKIDKILDKAPPKYDLFQKFIPHKSHGFDKLGRPLYIEKVGSIDWPTVVHFITNDELLHIHTWQMELAAKKAEDNGRRLGKQIETFSSIVDMAGLNMGHRKGLEFTRTMSALDQLYYPERMGRLFVINAPRLFPFFWNICKKWIHPNTAAKIEVLGCDNYQERLYEYIDKSVIPEEFGGTCRCGVDADGKASMCVPVFDTSKLAESANAGNAEFDSPYHLDHTIDARQSWEHKVTAGDSTNGCLIEWCWNCPSNDIEFSVKCIPIGPAGRGERKDGALQRTGSTRTWGLTSRRENKRPEEDQMEQKFALGEPFLVHPPKRVNQDRGSFRAPIGCTFVFIFDNSYSWFKSKAVRYLVRSETTFREADVEGDPTTQIAQ